MVSYNEFKELIKDNILDYLPEEYADANVSVRDIVKNNETLSGLIVQKSGETVTPTIYLDSIYESYSSGNENLTDIFERISSLRMEHDKPNLAAILENTPFSRMDDITDFNKVENSIRASLVGVEQNQDLLDKRPFTMRTGLATIYRIQLNSEMSMPVTNELLDKWNISVSDLDNLALENTFRNNPTKIEDMLSVLANMQGVPREELEAIVPAKNQMIVLRNEDGLQGAIGVFDVSTMEKALQTYGDMYILPSSIHEMLLVPVKNSLNGDITIDTLEQMVREVNETQVSPQERLSNEVYAYSKDGFQLARDYEKTHQLEQAQNLEKTKELLNLNGVIATLSEDGLTITFENTNDKSAELVNSDIAMTLGLDGVMPYLTLDANEVYRFTPDAEVLYKVKEGLQSDKNEVNIAEDNNDRKLTKEQDNKPSLAD